MTRDFHQAIVLQKDIKNICKTGRDARGSARKFAIVVRI
jgi:hypothetical protein